jgi:Flp pilus assembly protein TadG
MREMAGRGTRLSRGRGACDLRGSAARFGLGQEDGGGESCALPASSQTQERAKDCAFPPLAQRQERARDGAPGASFLAGWRRRYAAVARHARILSPGGFSGLMARCRLLREEGGNALVETALCISFLGLPVLVGTVELGTMLCDSIEVSNAAHAGATYAMMSSTFAADSAGITTAAQQEATDFGKNLTVTPTVYFACSQAISGTQYSTQAAANSACTGSLNHSLEFVQVSTSTTITPPIRCPGFGSTYTLVGVSVMEVEE